MASHYRARLRALVGVCAAVASVAYASDACADVTISSAATKNMSCSGGICAPTATKAVLNAGDLENMLGSGSVTVTTTGSGVEAGNLKVAAAVGWSTSSGLTLDAGKSIAVDQGISVTGNGGLSLNSNRGGSGGGLSFGAAGTVTFQNLSSSLSINGAAFMLVNSVASLANAANQNWKGNFALAGSYNAGGDGTYSQPPIGTFGGNFEGLGNAISNFSMNDGNSGDYAGLFYKLNPGSSISDFTLSNVTVTATGTSSASAMVGDNQGTIANSGSSGTVNGGDLATGGLAGYNIGSITNSWSTASVTGADAGGLVGQSQGSIVNSRASGNVAAVTGPNSPIGGGLVGDNQGTIEKSWATGSVTCSAQSSSLGGLIGEMDVGALTDDYATGPVSAPGGSVGGEVGLTFVGLGASYSTGAPSGSGSIIGGYVGDDLSSGMKHAYWDITTSGITNPGQGAGNIANDPGIKGLSTSKFQSRLPRGFRKKIWAIDSKINAGLPYLRSNPPTQ